MAWSYSNWVTLTGSARVDRLRLHIQEVSDRITSELDADGVRKSSTAIREYHAALLAKLETLEQQTPSGQNGGAVRSRAVFV